MFYTFSQNNSGGGFDVDECVTTYVIIEADSAYEADQRAENIGLYFDGVDADRDCPCCGDRWYRACESDSETQPLIGGVPVTDGGWRWVKAGEPYAYVYYKDGRKAVFSRPEED